MDNEAKNLHPPPAGAHLLVMMDGCWDSEPKPGEEMQSLMDSIWGRVGGLPTKDAFIFIFINVMDVLKAALVWNRWYMREADKYMYMM